MCGVVRQEDRIRYAATVGDTVAVLLRPRPDGGGAAGVLDPVIELFASYVGTGEVTGEPAFLMNRFLHLARASSESSQSDAAQLVDLFMNGEERA